MKTNNLSLSLSSYIGMLLLLSLLLAIYAEESIVNFVLENTGQQQIAESANATKQMSELILSLDKIKFDTTVLNSAYLENVKPFPNFPVDATTLANFGKANPFIGSFSVVTEVASTTVGGVVYSNQRATNDGNSIRAIPSTRR